MSIYVMTVGELAKRRGEPVGEFVKKVQAVGFDAGSHAKRLTQDDLNKIILLLDGNSTTEQPKATPSLERKVAKNPNVLLIPDGNTHHIVIVDASLNQDGTVSTEVISKVTETSYGESLLEFRKQLGLKMGVN